MQIKIINAIRLLSILLTTVFASYPIFVSAQGVLDVTGPLNVTSQDYDFGDSALQVAGFPNSLEVRGRVHYPSDLSSGGFPLVILMHGRHATCYPDIQSRHASIIWPCPGSFFSEVPSYQGYDYAAEALASHGYIVVSIGVNGVSGGEIGFALEGMEARARLLQHHLDLWSGFNSGFTNTFGNLFVGKIDMNKIGTMGHSRGGEGVANHFLYNRELSNPYNIKAMLLMAPTNFFDYVINDVPFGVILPYCDGDLASLSGVQYYDDARYSSAVDTGGKHTFLVVGANHNFFNTFWTPELFTPGATDDWINTNDQACGTNSALRLSSAQQRRIGAAIITTFFRTYLGDEQPLFGTLTGDDSAPALTTDGTVYSSYHPPTAKRLDINRLDSEDRESVNTLGGAASQYGLVNYEVCGASSDRPRCLEAGNEPHARPRHAMLGIDFGAAQLRVNWNTNNARYENQLPQGNRNFSTYSTLQFRAGINYFENPANQIPDFHVELQDGQGATSSVRVGSVSDALYFASPGVSRKLLLNTIRIPMNLFTGMDLSDVRTLRFNLDETAQGSLLVNDLMLADAIEIPPGCDAVIGDSFTFGPGDVSGETTFCVTSNLDGVNWNITGNGSSEPRLTIDLRGHTITGSNTMISVTNRDNVVLRNGEIRWHSDSTFSYAIGIEKRALVFTGADNLLIENITAARVSGNNIYDNLLKVTNSDNIIVRNNNFSTDKGSNLMFIGGLANGRINNNLFSNIGADPTIGLNGTPFNPSAGIVNLGPGSVTSVDILHNTFSRLRFAIQPSYTDAYESWNFNNNSFQNVVDKVAQNISKVKLTEFLLKNSETEKCLQSNSHPPYLQQASCVQGNAGQTWERVFRPNGIFLLKNKSTNRCLVANRHNMSALFQHHCWHGYSDQLWREQVQNDGDFLLRNESTGRCLVGNRHNRSTLFQWNCYSGYYDQRWSKILP